MPLLGVIAILPLAYKDFWEKNYATISIVPGLVVVFHTSLEWASFISLINALFVVAGG